MAEKTGTCEHFQTFAKTLKRDNAAKYEDVSNEDLLLFQKDQVEKLVALEKEFREALIECRWGEETYKRFVEHICEERRNILDARPFFRERQTMFTAEISGALKNRDHKSLYKHHINWQFVVFVLNSRKWKKTSKVYKLSQEIKAMRTELVEMNLPLAISRARIFWSRTPKSHLTHMDLVQISCEGLMSGIDKFCLPFSEAFRAVCIGRITGNMIASYSLDTDTILTLCDQTQKKIKDFKPGDLLWGVNDKGERVQNEVVAIHDHGMLEGFEVEFDDGYKLVCSLDHKFLTPEGMLHLRNIVLGGSGVYCDLESQRGRMADLLRTSGSKQKGNATTPEVVSGLQRLSKAKDVSSRTFRARHHCKGGVASGGGVDIQVWGEILDETEALCSSKDLYGVSRANHSDDNRKHYQMEGTEPRICQKPHERSSREATATISRASREEAACWKQNKCCITKNEERTPRRIRCQDEKGLGCSKAIQNGGMVESQWDGDLGGRSNPLWGQPEASGFCVTQSQDLDRSRRFVSFSRGIQGASQFRESPVQGCDAQGRGDSTGRCNTDSTIDEVFSRQGRGIDSGMARVAYKNAPLTNTGDLVLRQIVRIHPVGFRPMCDLEVSHPKHNFCLPNGVVTSNSETTIHFFPADKRKIYRANKAASKVTEQYADMDFGALALAVNKDVEEYQHLTTPSEIAGLMAAASCVSATNDKESAPVSVLGDKKARLPGLTQHAAPPGWQPDIRYEQTEIMHALHKAFERLPILEAKVLKMVLGANFGVDTISKVAL